MGDRSRACSKMYNAFWLENKDKCPARKEFYNYDIGHEDAYCEIRGDVDSECTESCVMIYWLKKLAEIDNISYLFEDCFEKADIRIIKKARKLEKKTNA